MKQISLFNANNTLSRLPIAKADAGACIVKNDFFVCLYRIQL